jgi:hypothetical protein
MIRQERIKLLIIRLPGRLMVIRAVTEVDDWDRDEGWSDRGGVLRWTAHEVVHHETDVRWPRLTAPTPLQRRSRKFWVLAR